MSATAKRLHLWRSAKYIAENPVKLSQNLYKITAVHGTRGVGHSSTRYA